MLLFLFQTRTTHSTSRSIVNWTVSSRTPIATPHSIHHIPIQNYQTPCWHVGSAARDINCLNHVTKYAIQWLWQYLLFHAMNYLKDQTCLGQPAQNKYRTAWWLNVCQCAFFLLFAQGCKRLFCNRLAKVVIRKGSSTRCVLRSR